MWRECPPPDACIPKRLPSASGGGPQQLRAFAASTPPVQTPSSPSRSHPRFDISEYTWRKGNGNNVETLTFGPRVSKPVRRQGGNRNSYPFCVKSMFFSGRMERIWLSTWSGLVWLVRVTLYCAWWKTQPSHWSEFLSFCCKLIVFEFLFYWWWICFGGFRLSITLILRGPSRRARRLFGVSMVITLSRPLSREPNIFPPRFFFPLSPVTAKSSDLDLKSTEEKKKKKSLTLAQESWTALPIGLHVTGFKDSRTHLWPILMTKSKE